MYAVYIESIIIIIFITNEAIFVVVVLIKIIDKSE